MKYKLTVSEKNCELKNKNDKLIRTPNVIYFEEKDKRFWQMQLVKKGITVYTIEPLEITIEKPDPPRITISKEPVRPSQLARGKEE